MKSNTLKPETKNFRCFLGDSQKFYCWVWYSYSCGSVNNIPRTWNVDYITVHNQETIIYRHLKLMLQNKCFNKCFIINVSKRKKEKEEKQKQTKKNLRVWLVGKLSKVDLYDTDGWVFWSEYFFLKNLSTTNVSMMWQADKCWDIWWLKLWTWGQIKIVNS